MELLLRFELHQGDWGHLPFLLAEFAALQGTEGRGKERAPYHEGSGVSSVPARPPSKECPFAACEARGAQLLIRLEEPGTDSLR